MKFVKMHGIGNDYVYIDAFTSRELERRFEGRGGAELIRRMSDRHRGIGGDGVILVCAPVEGKQRENDRTPISADVRMRMFNADGSESEMCGNGVRCVAKYAHDRLGVHTRPMRIQTGRGTLSIDYEVANGKLTQATVDMGEPILEPDRIPVDQTKLRMPATLPNGRNVAVERRPNPQRLSAVEFFSLDIDGETFHPRFVSMGNPHAIVAEPGTSEKRLMEIGPKFERHGAFPNRINVHFVEWKSDREVTMKTWERGAGITQACGTGACAVVVAGAAYDGKGRDVLVHLPGGELRVRWDVATNHVLMTGPAADVFEGEWPDD